LGRYFTSTSTGIASVLVVEAGVVALLLVGDVLAAQMRRALRAASSATSALS
jgi:hypothetical protein